MRIRYRFLAVKMDLPFTTVCLTMGGTVYFGETWFHPRHELGCFADCGDLEEGSDTSIQSTHITINCPDISQRNRLLGPALKGSRIELYDGEVDPDTGAVTTFDQLFIGRWDYSSPNVEAGDYSVNIELVSNSYVQLRPRRGALMTQSFHQEAWPGEVGIKPQTGLPRDFNWRINSK